MKPCELRAAVELAKLRQVSLEGLLTVAVDCAGTYEPRIVRSAEDSLEALGEAMIVTARQGKSEPEKGPRLRHACTICVHPVAPQADLAVHFIGVGEEAGIVVELAEEGWAEPLGLTLGIEADSHRQAVSALVHTRQSRRNEDLDAITAEMSPRSDGTPGLVELFDQCQRCYNCSVACPLCYCKECLFRTETLRPEPRRFQALAGSRGLTRMPGDAIAFQLTRLNHVSTSCVGCGLCTSACPADLPIDAVFQAVARRTQGLFEYVPGRAVEDPLPATTFKRDEFVTLGED
jgi:formate dehydrogenase subunit beta